MVFAGGDFETEIGECLRRYPTRAELRSREHGPVENQHRHPGLYKTLGTGRAPWSSTHDDDIEFLHFLRYRS